MKSTRFSALWSATFPREVQVERLRRLIREELTDLQRYTVTAYYFNGLTLDQIARERGVNKSSVSRTLRRAEKKLRKFLSY